MNKLYDIINWVNNTTPALNEANLNRMSKAIDDIDDRIIEIAADIMVTVPELREDIAEVEELEERLQELTERPPYIGANGNWYVWDTETGQYVDSGIDASITVRIADIIMLDPSAAPYVTNTGTNTDPIFHLYIPRGKGISSIAKTGTSGLVDTYTITYSDGMTTSFTVKNGRGITAITLTEIDTSTLIDTYTITYNDGSTSTFHVKNGKSAYQAAVDEGYQGSERQFNMILSLLPEIEGRAEDAALHSEAWAIGKRNGEEVPSTDPTYHNNSKYYSGRAAVSENAASTSAYASDVRAKDSEAWAAGKRGGTDVSPSDDTYHNNSKYYSEQAAASVSSASSILSQVEAAGEDAVEAIENALDISMPNFVMNLANGHLMYEGGRFDFEVNNSGHLMWGLSV